METLAGNSTLQPGEMLNWYKIKRVLGRGGFGTTYLAFDANLQMDVAIKEYLPDVISRRGNDNSVNPNTNEDKTTFNWGLTSFLNEARTLVKFKHPNIVRVMAVFEANGTAYMVMEFEHGQDLKKLLSKSKQPDENFLKELIVPIIDGLAEVHRCGFIHRDIKPANIYIRDDGTPVLLDFGSARLAHSDTTQNLTALVSVGFTPFEQYGNTYNQNQGPWTDIYSLGAVLYFAITGNPPTDCTLRASAVLSDQPDPLQSIAIIGRKIYSAEFLAAIDWALKFKVTERPKTLEAWRTILLSDGQTVRKTPVDTGQSHHYSAAALEATGSILQLLREPRTQKISTEIVRDSDADAPNDYQQLFDNKGGWGTPATAQPSTPQLLPKRTMRFRVSALTVSILVVAGIIGYWAWQQDSENESTANSVNAESEAEIQQGLDLTTQTSVASQVTQQGKERKAEENTKQEEIAAQQARDVEAARQAEIDAQQASDVETARLEELAAQQARDIEAAKQAEIVAQQARIAKAARQTVLAPDISGIKFGEYHALIIGNSQFENLQNLKTPENDAVAVEALLREKYEFKTNLLLNATRYDILSAFKNMRENLTYEDNLLIYYAGHGELAKETGYWLPVDAEPDNDFNWIPNSTITKYVETIDAKHIMIVADSSYSKVGRAPLAKLIPGLTTQQKLKWYETNANSRVRTVFESGAMRPVVDSVGGASRISIFSAAFLDELNSSDEPVVPTSQLFLRVQEKVKAEAARIGLEQNPQYSLLKFAGHESGEFLFVAR